MSGREPLPLVGRRTRLEPLATRHLEGVLDLLREDQMAGRWPPLGSDLTIANVEQRIWNTGDLLYVVLPRASDEVVGFIGAHGFEDVNASAALGFAVHPRYWLRGWPFEAAVLFLDLLFRWHGLRKVYCEMTEATAAELPGVIGRWLSLEATFRSHVADGQGGYQDWHVLAFSREQWPTDLVQLVIGRP